MTFMQTFGATVLAMLCYVIIVFLANVLLDFWDDKDDALVFNCLFIGCIMFAAMFVVWYMGVPVPAWMR